MIRLLVGNKIQCDGETAVSNDLLVVVQWFNSFLLLFHGFIRVCATVLYSPHNTCFPTALTIQLIVCLQIGCDREIVGSIGWLVVCKMMFFIPFFVDSFVFVPWWISHQLSLLLVYCIATETSLEPSGASHLRLTIATDNCIAWSSIRSLSGTSFPHFVCARLHILHGV